MTGPLLIFATTALLSALAVLYPLLGSLGPESGLLFGAVMGPLLFFVSATTPQVLGKSTFQSDLSRNASLGGVALLLFAFVLWCNSFFVTSCAPARGLLPFLAHAGPVIAFDCAAGLLLRRVFRRTLFAFLAALLLALAYLAFRAWIFWQAPSFRFLSHPLLAVDADLWQGAGLSHGVVGFRIATLFFAFGMIAIGFAALPRAKASTRVAATLFFALGALIHFNVARELQPSSSERQAELSRVLKRGIIVVHSDPKATSQTEAQAILAEATLWRQRLLERMGPLSKRPVHIWLYPDFETLQHFTGAKNVHFALPFRREIHITNAAPPHPTLGHELAHVFIGEKATTILGIPGVFGLFPNQGLSEGLAMMLTPELSIKNDLTLQEQAAALKQAGKMPALKQIFAVTPLAFFTHNASLSYSLAGAFLTWFVDQAPSSLARQQRIARLAAEGRVDADFRPFNKVMQGIALPPDALPSVETLFSRASVLSNTCEESPAPPSAQAQVLQASDEGDKTWREGHNAEALAAYRKLEPELLPPSLQRSPELKKRLAQSPDTESSQRALGFLAFVGTPSIQSLWATLQLGRTLATPELTPLVQYLILRPAVLSGAQKEWQALDGLTKTQALPDLFLRESLRSLALANAWGQEPAQAAARFRQLAATSPRPSERLQMLDFADRAERIAAALSLDQADPRHADIWLLGTDRFSN